MIAALLFGKEQGVYQEQKSKLEAYLRDQQIQDEKERQEFEQAVAVEVESET